MLWLLSAVAGLGWLAAYQARPGPIGRPPPLWPVGSALPTPDGTPVLLLFAHAHCPCTNASLQELAALMARCQGRVAARVVLPLPEGVPAGWTHTALRAEAARIPGVGVVDDAGGEEARRFGAATSGQALLYSPAGRLLYNGGVTAGRGHAGDNRGRSALLRLILRGGPGHADDLAGLVFGCPLFAEGGAP